MNNTSEALVFFEGAHALKRIDNPQELAKAALNKPFAALGQTRQAECRMGAPKRT